MYIDVSEQEFNKAVIVCARRASGRIEWPARNWFGQVPRDGGQAGRRRQRERPRDARLGKEELRPKRKAIRDDSDGRTGT